jgi:hypothetical protein
MNMVLLVDAAFGDFGVLRKERGCHVFIEACGVADEEPLSGRYVLIDAVVLLRHVQRLRSAGAKVILVIALAGRSRVCQWIKLDEVDGHRIKSVRRNPIAYERSADECGAAGHGGEWVVDCDGRPGSGLRLREIAVAFQCGWHGSQR